QAATPSSATQTQLAVTVPVGATSGTVSVTTGGNTAASSQSFTVSSIPPPTITGVSPTLVAGGATLTISGTNFSSSSAKDNVVLNSSRLRVTSASATSLSVVVPAGAM